MSFNTIPENGWPQLKRLEEIAQKVGNIPTFTSSDKEALEDLLSNAQALIAVAEDGAEGVPFDNTGTEFSSTDVQSAIEEAASMGGGGVDYSTTETDTGLSWIDGNPIYQRVFEFENALTVGASAWVSAGIAIANIGRIIRADSMYTNYTYYPIMADYYNDDVKLLSCRKNDDTYVKYLVLQYTKISPETRKRGK